MKLIETLTEQQINDLLAGSAVGIFNNLFNESEIPMNMVPTMCLEYYMSRSGEKPISVIFERMIKYKVNPETYISNIIREKFTDKWNRIYNALIAEYDPLYNEKYTEKKTGDNTDTTTYDTSNKKIGSNSDNKTYNTTIEDNGKVGRHEVNSRNENISNDVYGFNSVSPVGDDYLSTNGNDTFIADADKNTTSNTEKKTGTENRDLGIDETDTKTGTDTENMKIDETKTTEGRNVSSAALINEEIELRITNILFDIIYDDIDSVATLPIYI